MDSYGWFIEEMEALLQGELPGVEAHTRMIPDSRPKVEDLEDRAAYRSSAVMALIYPDQQDLKMLYIQRPEYDGHHSGQIAFPGGKQEKQDSDLLETALRETREEVGIHPKKIKVLGRISPVVIPVSKFIVYPYLGWMEKLPNLSLQKEEVADTLHFRVNHLLDESNEVIRSVMVSSGMKMKVPCFEFDEKIVWGATALMTSEIAHMLRFSEKVKQNI